ncbi:hypothetical protein BGZ95_005543 [Linnemannia exigua]|uniref:polynucleotide adenylyltransferase n=1 Tax=Linnemannia exigua TaxID=604196 RepID=A0AAD4H181_9FUNG|nr:hypothetical protein BGZ95_005543 [Linnemannia exigua]
MLPLSSQPHELTVADGFSLHLQQDLDQPIKIHPTPQQDTLLSRHGHHLPTHGQGQSLAHPSVTLHSHRQHQQQQQQQQQQEHYRPPHQRHQQQTQVRPDSPTSLEDSLSEGSVDSLSIDSTDSADSVDMPDPLFHGSNARRPSSDRNQSSILTHPVGPSSNSLRTRNDHQQFSKPKSLTPRLLSTFDSPIMMATPPLSPTRQSAPCEATQELSAQESSQGICSSTTAAAAALEGSSPAKTYKSGSSNSGNGGHGNGGGHDRRRNQPTARSRADSAPPTSRTVWPARPTVEPTEPIVAVEPPRIPTQRPSSQAVSAWNSLLTGVSPVRVNPRPVVRPSSRSNGSSSSNEQRRQQDVPIMLAPEREGRLTMEMYSLFETILPTEESHQRRTRLISKIEEIVETEWPGQDIRVLPFGSTINDLGTNTSDVDICILTSWLGLQGVEMLAEVFRKHGMENVFCVPGARVPIVKLWDPELQLSCDMNINTQLGIMNSRMVKTYVAIDHRVRPFAMIIKHWARKRVLNDAANGGTISTYTWICMVINFLQMRSPPILPSLHDMPHELSPDNQVINGNNTSFFSDLSKLEGFGSANKESLGGLLYAFFRKFAIEFDYDHHVASVRHGCYLTKESKGWHLPGKHYRLLCVEEPFDTTRNLGNSCDMASSKGLKHEFKRALDILNHNGSLDQVCEQWIFPSSYYHNTNNNGYRSSNSNGQFSGNNTASLGRRYAAGFTNGSSNYAEGRQDRNGNERRPRSSSASVAMTSSVPVTRLVEATLEKLKEDGAQLEKPLEETLVADPPKKESVTQSDTIIHHTGSQRTRRSSVHSSDITSGSHSSAVKQGDKVRNPGSPSSTINSQRRSKPSGTKGNGLEGTKGNSNGNSNHGSGNNNGSNSSHSRQKNGRSGAGGHRESGGHGGKAPRATVELCLADIAKTTPQLFANSKGEATLSDSSDAAVSAGGADASESADAAKKKKTGKKSLLWSTNSNRGESGPNHHHHQSQHHGHNRSSKPQDHHGENNNHNHNNQQTSHATKTKTAVVPEAGPLVDSSGETVPRP